MSLLNLLIDVDDSILIVIDVQEYLLAKLPAEERELLVNRIGWLTSVAIKLNVPLVVTAENISELGGIAPPIVEKLAPDTPIFNKMVFGLAEDHEIISAVKATGLKTAILVGLETDVCIAHSAIGLIQRGYQLVVVADATAPPGAAHAIGLERMRRAGILVSSVKSLYYEWIRTVDRDEEFLDKYEIEIGLPHGVIL